MQSQHNVTSSTPSQSQPFSEAIKMDVTSTNKTTRNHQSKGGTLDKENLCNFNPLQQHQQPKQKQQQHHHAHHEHKFTLFEMNRAFRHTGSIFR